MVNHMSVASWQGVHPDSPNMAAADPQSKKKNMALRIAIENGVESSVFNDYDMCSLVTGMKIPRDYARMTLLVHKPWKAQAPPRLSKDQWIQEFKAFIADPDCPDSVKIAYARVKHGACTWRNPNITPRSQGVSCRRTDRGAAVLHGR
jgi:hypothetical protein